MVLKQIITRNIQSHKEVVIDLPLTGLILLTGENSNGKSVIVRTTRDILQNNIKKPQCRADLVNREASFGEITYVRSDDAVLTVHITREAASTYFVLKLPDHEDIVRYLADKNYMELVRVFGWNVCEDTGVSLNIAEGDEALLFYKTPNKINGKVLQSANTDPVAELVLEQCQETLKETRTFKDNAVAQTRIINGTLSGLQIYDMELLSEYKQKLEYYNRNLGAVYFPRIPEIPAVPEFTLHYYYTPKLPDIDIPQVYQIRCEIPDIIPIAEDLEKLKNHECPVCGRRFCDACESTVSS